MDELLRGLIEDLQKTNGDWNANYEVLQIRNEIGLPFVPMKQTQRLNAYAKGYTKAVEDISLLSKREKK